MVMQFMTLSYNNFSEAKGKLKCLKSQGESEHDEIYFILSAILTFTSSTVGSPNF